MQLCKGGGQEKKSAPTQPITWTSSIMRLQSQGVRTNARKCKQGCTHNQYFKGLGLHFF